MATATDNASGTVAGLVGGIVSDAQTLLQQQLTLARVEITQEVNQAKQGAVYLGIAGALGAVALVMLAGALAIFLSQFMLNWLAFLIVGGVLAAAAGVFASFGLDQLGDVTLVPKRATKELTKTVEQVADTAAGG